MQFPNWMLGLCFLAAWVVATPGWAVAPGEPIEPFSLADYRGKTWSLDDFQDRQFLVVVFLGTECPLARLYGPRLSELAERYRPLGVGFVGVNANQQDSLSEIEHYARMHQVRFPILKDTANRVADQFAAQRTPEVFVLDRQRIVRYHGRIDDQYTYGVQRTQVNHDYLVEALDALIAGRGVAKPETEAVGCHIGRILEPDPASDVTYSRQIARIFQQRCVECHRPGEIAPFSLTNYEEVVGWAEMIAEVVRQQRMPPWHADPQYGHFINDARLTDHEKSLIYQWVEAGAPEGDPAEMPEPRTFVEGWRIGQPDQVIYMSDEPFQVPAEGEVKYQYFVVDPGFTEDKWVQAAECRPDNRTVVHHIIVAVRPPGSKELRLHGPQSHWLAATAPGARPMILRPGTAKHVPAGSKLVFQMHYTPNGSPQKDRSSVGLVFADPSTVRQVVSTQAAANRSFIIPAHRSVPPRNNFPEKNAPGTSGTGDYTKEP